MYVEYSAVCEVSLPGYRAQKSLKGETRNCGTLFEERNYLQLSSDREVFINYPKVRNFIRYVLRSEGGKNRVLKALTGFCYSSHYFKLESCHLAFDSYS